MLIRFNVANYLSFDKETEFSMLAAKSLKTHKEHKYKTKGDLDVLKASAIYGANGAGKSNLIKAIRSLKSIVDKGAISTGDLSSYKFRLNKNNASEPIYHEIEFFTNGKIYTYGLSFDSNIVLEEWLYETGTPKGRMIFERKYSPEKQHSEIKVVNKYIETAKAKMLISLMEENLLKQNELFLSKNEELKYEELNDAVEWIKESLTIIYPDTNAHGFVPKLCIEPEFKAFTEDLLKTFNVGIEELEIHSESLESFISRGNELNIDVNNLKQVLDEGKSGELASKSKPPVYAVKENGEYVIKSVETLHRASNSSASFTIREESDGTQRLMDFIPMIEEVLSSNKTFIIDEIDRSIHSSLLHALINKIMKDNNTQGQLIFSTHESSLLDFNIFRADEIWFVEKNRDTQSTELYTLNEFKPRADLDIEKGYLNGRFGAIPFLSKLEDLNWSE